MNTFITVIVIIICIVLGTLCLLRYTTMRYIRNMRSDLCKDELIISLCLDDRRHINISNREELERYVKRISPDYERVARVIRNNVFIPGEYSYRVKFAPEGNNDYQWWVFYLKINRPTDIVGVIVDESDAVKTSALKKSTRQKAVEARKQENFMQTLSDSLRAPLSDICENCNAIACDDTLTEEEKKTKSDAIAETNDYLIRQINDILLFSRISSGRQKYDIEKIEVEKFLRSLFEEYEYTMPENVELSLELGRPNVFVYADIKRLADIMLQYIDNARRFTTEGFICIGWQYHLDRHVCEIFVEDAGKGISSERQVTIFEMFSKTHELAEGVGLGLNIAKSLAEAMGGYISVDSREGMGSRFSVWLDAQALPFGKLTESK